MKQANEMSHGDIIRHPDGGLYRIIGIHAKCVAAQSIEDPDGSMAIRWLYYSRSQQYELEGNVAPPQYMKEDCACLQQLQSWDREYPVAPAPTFYVAKRHSSDLKTGERFKFAVGRLQRHRVVAVDPDVLVYRDPDGRLQEVLHCMVHCIELLEGEVVR